MPLDQPADTGSLAADVQIIGTAADAGGDDRVAIVLERPRHVEDRPGAPHQAVELLSILRGRRHDWNAGIERVQPRPVTARDGPSQVGRRITGEVGASSGGQSSLQGEARASALQAGRRRRHHPLLPIPAATARRQRKFALRRHPQLATAGWGRLQPARDATACKLGQHLASLAGTRRVQRSRRRGQRQTPIGDRDPEPVHRPFERRSRERRARVRHPAVVPLRPMHLRDFLHEPFAEPVARTATGRPFRYPASWGRIPPRS